MHVEDAFVSEIKRRRDFRKHNSLTLGRAHKWVFAHSSAFSAAAFAPSRVG